MKPDVETMLRVIGERLAGEVAPAISDAYLATDVNYFAILVLAIADQWDDAAAWRHAENTSLRALFARAAPLVPDLRADLEAAIATPPAGLCIRELEADNAVLRALLIRLHEAVEALPGEEARALEAAILAELADGVRRRTIPTTML